MTTAETVARAQQGDPGAMTELYRSTVTRVQHLVWRMLKGDPTHADDVVQEVYLQAFRGLPRFNGRAQFSTWLHRVAVNVTLQFRAKLMRRQHLSLDADTTPDVPARGNRADPLESVAGVLDQEHVQALITRLNPRHRQLIELCTQMSYAEIAKVTGTTVDIVKGRLHRARRRLEILLESPRHDIGPRGSR